MTITITDVKPRHPHYGVYEGVPIARYYIDEYIRSIAGDIRGKVLEFGAPTYSQSLNCAYEIIDIDPANKAASLHADICGSDVAQQRPEHFDFIICTAVLQLVSDPALAVDNMRQMLRPGGALILAEKSISKIDSWFGSVDRWRFAPQGLRHLLRDFSHVTFSPHGNVYAICAYLLGIPSDDIERTKLDYYDPEHPLVTIARATK
jgi:SAM-dependent methyltransferase